MDDRDRRDDRDDLDAWLHARIDPLPPPPGTFEMVKRRARRRRYRQVAVSAAAAAVLAAAVIAVPRVTSVLHITQDSRGSGIADRNTSASDVSPGTLGASGTPEPPAASSAAAGHPAVTLPPVPADVAATSVTFVGPGTGWVIGQAGVPGQKCSTQYCTSVARTDNAGASWYGVPAPLAGPPDGASGVSQIRFLNTEDGWAFGPQLFATHDGGRHWKAVQTAGQRVLGLEAVGGRAFAIFAACSGSGPGFAAHCTSFSLYSTAAGQDAWAPVPGLAGLGHGDQAAAASLVLTGTRGYLLAPDGTLFSGPVSGTGSWEPAGSGPAGGPSCQTGTAQADGQPAGAMLAAASPASLALACSVPAASGGGAQVFTSADGGATWQASGTVAAVTVTAVAAQPGGKIVLATSAGLEVSEDSGASWQPGLAGASGPPGGFSFVGMTNGRQGVAVPADPSQHAIWFTFSSGRAWQRSAVTGR